jgi:hypothetical protein
MYIIGKWLFPKLTRKERRRKLGGLILCTLLSLFMAGLVAVMYLWNNSSGRFRH